VGTRNFQEGLAIPVDNEGRGSLMNVYAYILI
jgi:hypothetical protein